MDHGPAPASVAVPGASSSGWRLTLFRVLAGLLGLVYLPGVVLMAAPWAPPSIARALPTLSPLIWAWANFAHPEIGRWTFALSACVDGAIAMILLVVAWRPLARPLLVQFLALALVVDLAANVPFVPGIAVGYSPLLVLLLAYPEPRRLVTPFWRGGINWPLFVLAVGAGALFGPLVWSALQAQIQGAGELASNYGWVSIVEHLCNLWLITLLSSFRRPGSGLLAALAGGCLVYLGVAAISVPVNPGSWGLAGGAVAILAGVVCLVLNVRSQLGGAAG